MKNEHNFSEKTNFKENFNETLEAIHCIRNEKIGDLNRILANKFHSNVTKISMCTPIKAQIEIIDIILKMLVDLGKN